jgi:hypothetical protein
VSAQILDIPQAEYHAIDAGSFHRLLDMDRSAAYAKWARENPKGRTPAMIRGEAFHALVLEPDAFDARFVLVGKCDAVLKSGDRKGMSCGLDGSYLVGGSWFCGKHKPDGAEKPSDVQALDGDTWKIVHDAAACVLADPVAKPILDACPKRERSVLWSIDGVPFKARPDAYGPRTLIDLKLIEKWHEDDFPRFLAESKVDRQLMLYRAALEDAKEIEPDPNVYVVAVAPDEPHEVRVYEVDDAMMAEAWEALTAPIARYVDAVRTGVWSSGPGWVIPATRAKWDKASAEDMAL